jgi:uncharacterized membrane protein
MKNFFSGLRDTIVAGILFLLPLLILLVLVAKVFQLLTGITTKIAGFFGLKSLFGISGGTIVGGIGLLLLCLLCGYLVRISFFNQFRNWLDSKLAHYIPGYVVYREMAISKLDKTKEELLPYESAAWIEVDEMQQPCFVIKTIPDGRCVIYLPTAGNVKEGTLFVLPKEKVQLCEGVELRKFNLAISNLGMELADYVLPVK